MEMKRRPLAPAHQTTIGAGSACPAIAVPTSPSPHPTPPHPPHPPLPASHPRPARAPPARTPRRRKSALVMAGWMRSMRINASRSFPASSFATRSLPKGHPRQRLRPGYRGLGAEVCFEVTGSSRGASHSVQDQEMSPLYGRPLGRGERGKCTVEIVAPALALRLEDEPFWVRLGLSDHRRGVRPCGKRDERAFPWVRATTVLSCRTETKTVITQRAAARSPSPQFFILSPASTNASCEFNE